MAAAAAADVWAARIGMQVVMGSAKKRNGNAANLLSFCFDLQHTLGETDRQANETRRRDTDLENRISASSSFDPSRQSRKHCTCSASFLSSSPASSL